MPSALAFKSSKLGHTSSKLAVRNDWAACDIVYSKIKTGFASQSAAYYLPSADWPYPGDPDSVIDWALANEFASTPVDSVVSATMKTDHSHGCSVSGHDHLNRYNDALLSTGQITFIKPTGFTTVASAFLRLATCGRVAHTIIRGAGGTNHVVAANMYTGAFSGVAQYLNNIFLDIDMYASPTEGHLIRLTQADLRALNGSNGVITAGLGRYTFKRNGYIDVPMPPQVMTILNGWNGINLSIGWGWDNAWLGGYCPYCIGDYNDTGYDSRIAARAVICTNTHFATNPQLYIR